LKFKTGKKSSKDILEVVINGFAVIEINIGINDCTFTTNIADGIDNVAIGSKSKIKAYSVDITRKVQINGDKVKEIKMPAQN